MVEASELCVEYNIVEGQIEIESVAAKVYGVRGIMYENNLAVSENVVEDIFCTREEAEAFAEMLRENCVDPCQIEDIADDWLQKV